MKIVNILSSVLILPALLVTATSAVAYPLDGYEDTGIRRVEGCLLYTSPSPRDRTRSRMPSSA